MELRKITPADFEIVIQIFSQARQAQRALGFIQWEDNYPSLDNLITDFDNNSGFVIVDDNSVMGYIAITTFDPEYERFPQLWNNQKRYAVFHRIAISDMYRGKGLSKIIFDLAENKSLEFGVEYIRIDTGTENTPTQRILVKRNYINLGICNFSWGKRMVFEKHFLTNV